MPFISRLINYIVIVFKITKDENLRENIWKNKSISKEIFINSKNDINISWQKIAKQNFLKRYSKSDVIKLTLSLQIHVHWHFKLNNLK